MFHGRDSRRRGRTGRSSTGAMVAQEAVGQRDDPLRTPAVFGRYRRMVSRTPSQSRGRQTTDNRRARDDESLSREGRLVDGERLESSGRVGGSGKELGRDERSLRQVFSKS